MSSDSDFSDDDRKKKGKNKSMDSDDSGSESPSAMERANLRSLSTQTRDRGVKMKAQRLNISSFTNPPLQVECLEELKLTRLSRFKLARFVHAPFFNKTVIDCYVRIGVGKLLGNPNKDNNKIAQVIDVIETDKVYNEESAKTKNNQELQEWMSTMRRHNRSLPTMGDIHKKMKDIASPVEHNYTNDEVNQLAESIRGEMAREMEGTNEQARVLHGRPPTTTTIEKE
ncbi:hypothetical protein PRIPAC_98141 [Pristionchus pacificus]|uniref:Plus3 domain-containing protein n=1 Tax=Pristionchus pacificus TaxID=54126 RepID=A0A2A6BW50_PRIPA|nr:hypothetical protein PRIPAC_98141 [Pristionchus pacificus]|eukprot:PDM70115.1 hypothetical protein PRIPAC_45254 [Pristionchus pacificus]